MLIKITSIDYRYGRIAHSERSKNVPDPYAPCFTLIVFKKVSTVKALFKKVSDQCTILLTFQLIANNVSEVRWRVVFMKTEEKGLKCNF